MRATELLIYGRRAISADREGAVQILVIPWPCPYGVLTDQSWCCFIVEFNSIPLSHTVDIVRTPHSQRARQREVPSSCRRPIRHTASNATNAVQQRAHCGSPKIPTHRTGFWVVRLSAQKPLKNLRFMIHWIRTLSPLWARSSLQFSRSINLTAGVWQV